MPEELEGSQGLEEGTAPESNEGTQPDGSQGSEEHSFADGFLSEIEDETQRRLLEPLVREKWEPKVTKKFQEYSDRIKNLEPYEQLGAPPEELKRSYELMQRVNQNPQEVLQALAQASGLDLNGYQQYLQSQQQAQNQNAQGQNGNQPQQDDPYEGWPEPVKQKFLAQDEKIQELEQLAQTLAQTHQTREQTEKQARANFEINQNLERLKKEYGDFDEQFVLLQLYNMGKEPEPQDWDNAVKVYQQKIQAEAAKLVQPSQQAPTVMSSGGSAPPPDNFDPKKASSGDTKNFVAQLLSQAQSQ